MATLSDMWEAELEAGGLSSTEIGDPEVPELGSRPSPATGLTAHSVEYSITDPFHAGSTWDKGLTQLSDIISKGRCNPVGVDMRDRSETQKQQQDTQEEKGARNLQPVRVSAAHPLFATSAMHQESCTMRSHRSPVCDEGRAVSNAESQAWANDGYSPLHVAAIVAHGSQCRGTLELQSHAEIYSDHSLSVIPQNQTSPQLVSPESQADRGCSSPSSRRILTVPSPQRESMVVDGKRTVADKQQGVSCQVASKVSGKSDNCCCQGHICTEKHSVPAGFDLSQLPCHRGSSSLAVDTGWLESNGESIYLEMKVPADKERSAQVASRKDLSSNYLELALDTQSIFSEASCAKSFQQRVSCPSSAELQCRTAASKLAVTDVAGEPFVDSFSDGGQFLNNRERLSGWLHSLADKDSQTATGYSDGTTVSSSVTGSPHTVHSSLIMSPRGRAAAGFVPPELQCERSIESGITQGTGDPPWQASSVSNSPHSFEPIIGTFQSDLDAFGPWCSACKPAVESGSRCVTTGQRHHSSNSSSDSGSSSSSSEESSDGSDGDCHPVMCSTRCRNASTSNSQVSSRGRALQRGASNTSGHVSVQFEEDSLDAGFVSIQWHKPRPRVQALSLRRAQHGADRGYTMHSSQRTLMVLRRMQRQLSNGGQTYDGGEGHCRSNLQAEELRKQRLAQPMRQRLLRQYTEHLRSLDAAKREAVLCEEQAEKIRPLLVKVALAGSRLKALQSSGLPCNSHVAGSPRISLQDDSDAIFCMGTPAIHGTFEDLFVSFRAWREYVGAAVTDVDADLSNFMATFGEDVSNPESGERADSSTGDPACSRFWKRRTVAGAFLVLMIIYLAIFGGVFVWLQQASSSYGPANSFTGHPD